MSFLMLLANPKYLAIYLPSDVCARTEFILTGQQFSLSFFYRFKQNVHQSCPEYAQGAGAVNLLRPPGNTDNGTPKERWYAQCKRFVV